MSQIHHICVVSKRKMNDDRIDRSDRSDNDQYKSFQRQQEMLNIQMLKMHEKELEEMANVENVVENVVANVVENVVQSPSDSLHTIRNELESYKKQTDGRIEKLVNLFLSIDK